MGLEAQVLTDMAQLGIKPAIVTSDFDGDIVIEGRVHFVVNKNFRVFNDHEFIEIKVGLCVTKTLQSAATNRLYQAWPLWTKMNKAHMLLQAYGFLTLVTQGIYCISRGRFVLMEAEKHNIYK